MTPESVPTWTQLNNQLRRLRHEDQAAHYFKQLKFAGAPARWLRRTQARFRQLRKLRERRELERSLKHYRPSL